MKLLAIVGTRPEAIKMAPVIAEGRRRGCAVVVCATAQHRQLLDQALDLFRIVPDHDLDLMRPDQTLADFTARALLALDEVVTRETPDWVLVQGDTTTAMVGALAAFYRRIPVAHVEAGLRTGDLDRPFPEELNRRLVDTMSRALFAPTATARENLCREGVATDAIYVTGNTVVDALTAVLAMPPPADAALDPAPLPGERTILVTAHRRESFGEGMKSIARALEEIAAAHPDVRIVFPLHPNPNVRRTMQEILGDVPRVDLIEPLPYLAFVHLLARSTLVVSDSGGVQEEAPALGVPAIVLREVTERPEAVAAGAVRLVGLSQDGIVAAVGELLDDPSRHAAMARVINPYGDGRAAERIVSILLGAPWTPFHPGGR